MPELLCDHDRTLDGKLTLQIPWVDYLRSQGYTVKEYQELHAVNSNSRDGSHVVAKMQTYRYPKDNALLDVGNDEHNITIWVCSCEDFEYNKSVDVSEPDVTPDMVDSCRHIQKCSMVQKAKNDDNQDTLL